MQPTRRRVLAGVAGVGTVGLAGCVGSLETLFRDTDAREEAEAVENPHRERTIGEVPPDTALPLRDREVPLAYDLSEFEEEADWGGVGKDGIPSIDDPQFGTVEEGDTMMAPDDPVFGVALNGDTRAYPQHILVHHEIVNDGFGDTGVAVTYCPLTGTAIGFERGSVEFGVSGMLTNSNLLMYDRETDSWWPQVLGTGILGERNGLALHEIRVTWTSWERWKTVHPETIVLTEDTGHARNYNNDPYGGYNPTSGYYDDDNLRFGVMTEDDRYHPKSVFIGARTADGAVAFGKERLREEALLETTVANVPYVAAYHPGLDSAWVYRNPENRSVSTDESSTDDGRYVVDGTSYDADSLPLTSVNAFDAMWFAWAAFYPDTVVVA